MTHHSAPITERARSYIVFRDPLKGLEVKPSHWEVGYTKAHKATPEEAIEYALNVAEGKMVEAQALVVELSTLKVERAWTPA